MHPDGEARRHRLQPLNDGIDIVCWGRYNASDVVLGEMEAIPRIERVGDRPKLLLELVQLRVVLGQHELERNRVRRSSLPRKRPLQTVGWHEPVRWLHQQAVR